jgi:hypothetical protein
MPKLLPLFLLALLAGSVQEVVAQRPGRPAVRAKVRREVLEADSHLFLRRTNIAIRHAQNKVREGKNYTGHLARAVRHQRFARQLHRSGQYHRAIHHSRVARRLAFLAIQANKGAIPADANFNANEDELAADAPSDTELEKELPADGTTLTDQDVLNEPTED